MKHTATVTFLLILLTISFFSKGQILINEIQSSNTKTIPDENYEYDDWIEIYNAGSSSVNLSGYGLTDDSLKPYKFIFPNYNLSAVVYETQFITSSISGDNSVSVTDANGCSVSDKSVFQLSVRIVKL